MNKSEETKNTYNNIAALYEEKFMDMTLYDATYDRFCELMHNAQASILEIGCGPGNITKYLLTKSPTYKILGIDVAEKMIDLARKNNPSVEFKVLDAQSISSLQTKFNGIIAGFCVPYLDSKETETFIQSSYQLLNDDGIIYISFVEGTLSEYKTGSGGRVYFYYHKLQDLEHVLTTNGFHSMETYKVQYPAKGNNAEIHTILIAKK
jgi:ubiquinone/menaquinone biosynthesis C-methylase UbiE